MINILRPLTGPYIWLDEPVEQDGFQVAGSNADFRLMVQPNIFIVTNMDYSLVKSRPAFDSLVQI